MLASVGFGEAYDIETAAREAGVAQKSWAAVSARERAEILRSAAIRLQTDAEALGQLVARETGGILPKGLHEVREAVAILHAAAALALQPRGEVLSTTPGRLSYARRVPRGV